MRDRRRHAVLTGAIARRTLVAGALGAAWVLPAWAQGGPPRIGFLGIEPPAGPRLEFDAFLAGLHKLGYAEGRNLAIETRFVGYNQALLRGAAEELVASKVAVIVAFAPSFTAAMAATKTIPIVIRTTVDPVKAGYVASLARPGGNVTGVSSASAELYRKRVQLLVELMPGIKRIAILQSPQTFSGRPGLDYRDEVTAAAQQLGIEALSFEARNVDELASAIAAAAAAHAQALIPLRSPLVVGNRALVAQLAASHRLPAIYDERAYVAAGGLISYGANLTALHERAAYYVDRILRGAKPGDLPIEEPTVYELVINMKAAKALALTVPASLLARADEVTE